MEEGGGAVSAVCRNHGGQKTHQWNPRLIQPQSCTRSSGENRNNAQEEKMRAQKMRSLSVDGKKNLQNTMNTNDHYFPHDFTKKLPFSTNAPFVESDFGLFSFSVHSRVLSQTQTQG